MQTSEIANLVMLKSVKDRQVNLMPLIGFMMLWYSFYFGTEHFSPFCSFAGLNGLQTVRRLIGGVAAPSLVIKFQVGSGQSWSIGKCKGFAKMKGFDWFQLRMGWFDWLRVRPSTFPSADLISGANTCGIHKRWAFDNFATNPRVQQISNDQFWSMFFSFRYVPLCCIYDRTEFLSRDSEKQVFGLHQSFLSLKTLDIAWMKICMILRHLDIMLTYSVHLGLTHNFEHLSHFHFPKIALKEMLWRRIRGKCISISKAALFYRFI